MSEKKTAKEMMKAIIAQHYEEARQAKAKGEPVGWSTTLFPNEITESFGLKIIYPENHSAAVSAKKAAVEYCECAEGMGYSTDLCSYARVNMGFAELKKEFEGLSIPEPDFVLASNNICNQVFKWYENLAVQYDIPFIIMDTPYNIEYEVTDSRIEYLKGQMEDIIQQFEQISGKKFDPVRFQEVMEISSENGKLFKEALKIVGDAVPSPISGLEVFNYMGVLVTSKGRRETTEWLRVLIEELKERVKNSESSYKAEEKYRIFWDGLACWPYLKHNLTTMLNNNVNVTGTVYADIFATSFDSVEEMLRSYNGTNNSKSIARGVHDRVELIKGGQCEGILSHLIRSCKPWVGIQFEMDRQIHDLIGLPHAAFDGDMTDPRMFSEAQFETRVQGLAEVMESRKEK